MKKPLRPCPELRAWTRNELSIIDNWGFHRLQPWVQSDGAWDELESIVQREFQRELGSSMPTVMPKNVQAYPKTLARIDWRVSSFRFPRGTQSKPAIGPVSQWRNTGGSHSPDSVELTLRFDASAPPKKLAETFEKILNDPDFLALPCAKRRASRGRPTGASHAAQLRDLAAYRFRTAGFTRQESEERLFLVFRAYGSPDWSHVVTISKKRIQDYWGRLIGTIMSNPSWGGWKTWINGALLEHLEQIERRGKYWG